MLELPMRRAWLKRRPSDHLDTYLNEILLFDELPAGYLKLI